MSIELAEIDKPASIKRITYRCNVCGYVGNMREDHYRNGVGCSVCSGKTVVSGINDVGTRRPDVSRYIVNTEDSKSVTPLSHRIVEMRCPTCGLRCFKRVSDVTRRGFNCRICTEKNGYPSRFVAAMLYVAGIKFEAEKVFDWAGRKRYDFFIPDEDTLIEVNGVQHYKKTLYSKNLDAIMMNDIHKREMAIENGYKIITIDAMESDFEKLKISASESGLVGLIDMSCLDWDRIRKLLLRKEYEIVLERWESGMKSTLEIARSVGLSSEAVRDILKECNNLGMCDYDKREQVLSCQRMASEARKRRIMCTNTNEEFNSIKDASEKYGVKYNSIQNCLAGRSASAGKDIFGNKLKWVYL